MPTFIDILIGRGNGTCSRVRISFRIRGDLKGIINTLDDNLFHTGRTIIFTPRYTTTCCIGNMVSIIEKFGNSVNCHWIGKSYRFSMCDCNCCFWTNIVTCSTFKFRFIWGCFFKTVITFRTVYNSISVRFYFSFLSLFCMYHEK